ncbi:hypothetical protein [Pseudophaeobacter sp.]|uniref:hypothetical protein n=1 Tax=Pseudophaeobacter sp. TaxID=1971739 RepID=UPI003A96F1AD
MLGLGLSFWAGSALTALPNEGGGGFSPASLFASGESGVWYDPSDLSTLWADTFGTTQAVLGGAVARMDDKSGNGNHVTQDTFAARAILRQSVAGEYYLEFDGVDDYLLTAAGILGGAATVFTLAAGVSTEGGAGTSGNDRPLSLGNATLGTAGGSARETFGQAQDGSLRYDGAFTAGALSLPSEFVRLSSRNGGSVLDMINAAESIGATATLVSTIDEVAICAPAGAAYAQANIHGVIVINRVLTAQEISDTETYLAEKAGVTL